MNVQINGDVHVHHHHCHCSHQPHRQEHSPEWGAVASFAAGRALHVAGNLILAAGWLVLGVVRVSVWTAARVSSGVLLVERQLGGGPTKLVSIGPGERVTEVTRYVD